MRKELHLSKPNVLISFDTDFSTLRNSLDDANFIATPIHDTIICYHGRAYLTENDPIVIHFYIDRITEILRNLIIHSERVSNEDTIIKSFQRKEIWLENTFGMPTEKAFSPVYGVSFSKWVHSEITIEHSIKDRFGDEEGIYIKCT